MKGDFKDHRKLEKIYEKNYAKINKREKLENKSIKYVPSNYNKYDQGKGDKTTN